jgi:hypothetical protein
VAVSSGENGRVDDTREPEAIVAARALVGERFGAALAAFLGGGVLSSRRTATSDLDIVVVLAGPPAPYRESLHWRGWPAETFVHDAPSLEHFFAADTGRRRPSLARMIAEGAVLAGGAEDITKVRERARAVLAAGPPVLSRAELEGYRYVLVDLLDDLAGAVDPGEMAVIGWNLWTATAELALLLKRHWLGSGKWLLRELRTADPELADEMVTAAGDPQRLSEVSRRVLDQAGGPGWDGYRLAGR